MPNSRPGNDIHAEGIFPIYSEDSNPEISLRNARSLLEAYGLPSSVEFRSKTRTTKLNGCIPETQFRVRFRYESRGRPGGPPWVFSGFAWGVPTDIGYRTAGMALEKLFEWLGYHPPLSPYYWDRELKNIFEIRTGQEVLLVPADELGSASNLEGSPLESVRESPVLIIRRGLDYNGLEGKVKGG